MSPLICRPLLPADLRQIGEQVRRAPALSLFLDFDGTLTPLVNDPSSAWLGIPMRAILEDLAHRPRILPAVISGRALDDIRRRVGIANFIYAGNHGLEITGRGMHFVHPLAATRRHELEVLCSRLSDALLPIPGAQVEYKGLTAAVHYRRAARGDIETVERLVSEYVAGSFVLQDAAMAINIVPETGWNKGAAVCWIHDSLAESGALAVCFGDDNTDEDAFRSLAGQITVRVGERRPTAARYCVAGPDEVLAFLNWLRSCQ